MDYVVITRTSGGFYLCKEKSNIEMEILGHFFVIDIGCSNAAVFKKWALESTDGDICGGNTTSLEKEINNILIEDSYSEETIPTTVRMTVKQFAQLFDEWQDKVVKLRPKEVTIKHENGRFFIETSNE